MRGAGHFYRGRRALAARELQRSVRLAPSVLGGRMWLLVLGRFLGDDEVGARATRKFIESEPLFWPARYQLGELRREQGRIPEAVSEFKKVMEQDPRNSTTLRCLARTYLDA